MPPASAGSVRRSNRWRCSRSRACASAPLFGLRGARRCMIGTWPMVACSSRAVCGCGLAITSSNGEDAFAAAIAEARRVRAAGGIVDASTLGKIEIAGADAAAFLDAMYLTKAGTIKVGRSKYMVNLREDGMVLDDGLVLRLAERSLLRDDEFGSRRARAVPFRTLPRHRVGWTRRDSHRRHRRVGRDRRRRTLEPR